MIKALSKAEIIVANSNFTKNMAIKNLEKKIRVINPGCNLSN